jgi:MSHA biogenesis protein MshQ
VPVHPAGMGFNLTVTAVNSAGLVTQGYRPQAIDRLRAYAQRTGPTTGSEGTFKLSATGDVLTAPNPPAGPGDYLACNVGPGEFVNGVYSNVNASYSEVGLVRLYLMDSDYMGHTIPASPIPVGRFVPDAFQVAPVILNRAATAGCTGGNFTYMGEGLRLSMQLMAKNASGGITRNYQGAFAAFNGSGFASYTGLTGNTLAAQYLSTDLSGRLALNGVALSVPWAAGVATLDIDLSLQSAAAADGPYDGTRLGLAFSDSDGVALRGLDMDVDGNGSMDHLDAGATDFRAGRLSVGNAHGSELRDLSVPVAMQFFAGPGLGFVTHTLDNCTPITSTTLSDADTGDSLPVSETCIVDQLGASGADACAAGTVGNQYRGTALAGEYVVSLKSPGAGRTGGLRVTADAPAWAEFDWISAGNADPVGIATFGIYNRNTEFIYQRELR